MKKLPISNFYIKSSLFSILSLLAAACSYILYPVLIRILPSNEFGDFAVTTTILNQVLSVFLSINIVSIYFVKKFDEETARQYVQLVQKILLWLFVLLCCIVIIISPLLKNLLKISDFHLFIPLAGVLLASVPITIWNGYLQGHKELVRVGIFSLSASLAKLLFAILLGILFGAVGAIYGILVGTLLGIYVLQIYPGVKLPSLTSVLSKTSRGEFAFIWKLRWYIVQAVIVVGSIGFLQGYDISLAKILFEPKDAGIYSGIAVLSYILYYLAFILIWIILPEIQPSNHQSNKRLLKTAYKLFILIGILAVALEILLANTLVPLFLGDDYKDSVFLIVFATLYQLSLISISLYTFYLLILRRSRAILLVVYTLAACLILPHIFTNSPQTMIMVLFLSTIVGIIVYAFSMSIYKLITRKKVR